MNLCTILTENKPWAYARFINFQTELKTFDIDNNFLEKSGDFLQEKICQRLKSNQNSYLKLMVLYLFSVRFPQSTHQRSFSQLK